MSQSLQSPESTVRHGAKRADYDRERVLELIDELLICHIGQQAEGRVVVTPTCHWRDGDYLYWHAHAKARSCAGTAGSPVCVNLCSLDGLVLARSAFHHSVNYRSVTLFGVPEAVENEVEKAHQLQLLVERLSRGRWQQLRPMRAAELKATAVVRLRIDNASAKVRQGPPLDDASDLDWPVWAGEMALVKQWQPRADSMGQSEPVMALAAERL